MSKIKDALDAEKKDLQQKAEDVEDGKMKPIEAPYEAPAEPPAPPGTEERMADAASMLAKASSAGQALLDEIEGKKPEPEPEPWEPIDLSLEAMQALSPLQKAARRGRAAIDPRKLEELKRTGGQLDLGSMDDRLDLSAYADQLVGYHSHWANNDGNRIIEMLALGYEPIYEHGMERALGEEINENLDTWVSQRMGTMKDGKPLIVYALKIRNDAWEARQAAKRANIEETEKQIMSGTIGAKSGDGRYLKHVNITR